MNTKPLISEKVVNLSEIPEDGRSFSYSRESGELNEALMDLIGEKEPYSVEFYLRPIGNAYEITGVFKTKKDLLCSRCAIDFVHTFDESFKELLVVQDPIGRTGKSSHSNHVSEQNESGSYCNYLESERFDVGEFIHELIAMAEPIQPLGKTDCDDNCENYQMALKQGWLTKEENSSKNNPFAQLAGIKLPT